MPDTDTAVDTAVSPAGAAGRRPSPAALAWRDLRDGVGLWRLWGTMGWQDICQRYRGSVLGPFWLTLSTGIMVAALGVLYGKLFGIAIHDFLPHVCLGLLTWNLIASTVNDGCQTYVSAAAVLKQIRLPFTTYVFRVVWRNLLIFAHNVLVFVAVAVAFALTPSWTAVLAVPGLALIVANGVWATLLLGMACARFRDVPPIVASVMQISFFATPIIWKAHLLGEHAYLVHLNPFFAFVDLVRSPLLGHPPSPWSWLMALGVTAVGWSVTFRLFARLRARIPYWA